MTERHLPGRPNGAGFTFDAGGAFNQSLTAAHNALLERADQAVRDLDFAGALSGHLGMVYVHGIGRLTLRLDPRGEYIWDWDERMCVQGAGILKRIAKAANYLGLSMADLEARYVEIATPLAGPLETTRPLFTPAEVWGRAADDIESWISTGTTFRPKGLVKADSARVGKK